MNPARPPSFLSFLPATLLLCLIGWGGIILLVFVLPPDLGPRWLFFFLTTLALGGTFLPVMYFLHRRFPSQPPVEGDIILREALWFGVYGSALVWLQWGSVLTLGLAVVLGIILILVEMLLRMWERSRWKPKE